MKQSKKTAIVLTLVSLFLIALAIPSYSWTRTNVSKIEKFYNSKLSPIIMIPGSSATENRFDGLVTKLNQGRQGTKHSLLKVKVWNDGHITYSGSIDAKDNEPVIVVGFENNKDGYSNIKKQAKLFNQAFEALQEKYNFNNFKGLGHSNGGLIYTAFIENYLGDYDIDLKTLMTIGTPYNFTETNIKINLRCWPILSREKKPSRQPFICIQLQGPLPMIQMSWSQMPVFLLGSISTKTKQLAIRRLR